MNALIRWNEYPLRDVFEILRGNLNVDNCIVPRAQNPTTKKFPARVQSPKFFTPVSVVKEMVDAFELENIFWQTCVDSKCIEVACGEAPFITTRYDAESGEFVPVNQRVGILDRKFQAIEADDKIFWAKRAVQSVYGYELQADNLLIARANVLLSFAEFVEDFSDAEIREVATVIAKNFWQMDGLKIPDVQASLFDTNEIEITDWLTGDKYFFTGGFLKGNMAMKFDFLISNPPYQDDSGSGANKNFASPLYDKFMEAGYKVAEKAMFITPARFLFDAGATPKDFNRRMLDDPHLKVLRYEQDSKKFFRRELIEGGVVVTLYDKTQTFEPIGTFIPWDELKSVHQKVVVDNPNFKPLSEIIYSRKIFKLTEKFYMENPTAPTFLKDKNSYTIGTNAFAEMPEYFFVDMPNDGHDYIQIFGLLNNQRVYRWIRRDYVNSPAPLDKFKVFMPKANGASGKLGDEAARLISKPVIGGKFVGSTETFIAVGTFDSRDEAENCFKYIKLKFARVMLGILKATQDNTAEKWAKVPLQDFTSESDIDWSGDVDAQLYAKYNLSDAEINFIESHVKEMA